MKLSCSFQQLLICQLGSMTLCLANAVRLLVACDHDKDAIFTLCFHPRFIFRPKIIEEIHRCCRFDVNLKHCRRVKCHEFPTFERKTMMYRACTGAHVSCQYSLYEWSNIRSTVLNWLLWSFYCFLGKE